MSETVKLTSSDWESIFKVETFAIGKTVLQLRPLGLEDLAYVTLLISQISEKVIHQIPKDEKERKLPELINEMLPSILSVVQKEVPEAVSIMSKLDKEDVKNLPAELLLDLVTKCIEINIGSLESLSKNFIALAGKATLLSQGMGQTTNATTKK